MQGVYRAHVDRAKVDTAERLNRRLFVTGLAIGAVFAALVVVAIMRGFGWFTVVIAAFAMVAGLVSAILAHRRRRALGLLIADDGIAIAVGPDGVQLAGAPLIPWSEIVFVGVLDDRRRTGTLRRLPVIGFFASTAVRAGSATLLCELGVRDAPSLRDAFAQAPGGERVTVFDEFDGRRRGLVPLLLDAVLDDASAHQAAQFVIREAERRDIPARIFDRIFDYFEWKGPMIDHKWPVQKGTQ
ncbi:hypothetical protein [Agromyces laixinhei]|uniref:hypothetical protein n=1 Tax=Agromyces laixinhei TaxID=2585717 RepID=UPI0012ED8E0D|nr:hypothetical protein [Agromyces laixinhei]